MDHGALHHGVAARELHPDADDEFPVAKGERKRRARAIPRIEIRKVDRSLLSPRPRMVAGSPREDYRRVPGGVPPDFSLVSPRRPGLVSDSRRHCNKRLYIFSRATAA